MKRREFLTRSAAAGFGSVIGGLKLAIGAREARAEAEDYKALVCIFLVGGLDNHDTIIPYDSASFGEFARIRRDLLLGYAEERTLSTLLPLATPTAQFGGRQFALPPEMPGLRTLYDGGRAAVLANVGPLLAPVTRQGYEDQSARLPSRLFSHNDQQATWMAGAPEGAQFGWAGLFADELRSRNSAPEFSAITGGGNDLMVTGRRVAPYQVTELGAVEVDMLERLEDETLRNAVVAHLGAIPSEERGWLELDLATAGRRAFDSNARFNRSIAQAEELTTSFPEEGLGGQLRIVAQAIAARSALAVQRQVFVLSMGGFDTHSGQARNLPRLQASLDRGISAFQRAMDELGVSEQVTLFTASDFGRTLAVNDDGTDHGWGGHHFVVGGAVKGGAIYGDLPETTFGHALDAGSGRLIPTLAVEQMAAPLGRWFGLDGDGLAAALPRLGAFTTPLPGFI